MQLHEIIFTPDGKECASLIEESLEYDYVGWTLPARFFVSLGCNSIRIRKFLVVMLLLWAASRA